MRGGQDPAEGDRKTIERELARQESKSIKNPGQEAQNPGGMPTQTVRGSAQPKPTELEGQQGKTHAENPPPNFQRGN